MPERYTTLGQSTLNGSYTSGGSTLTLTSAASFPSAGNFRFRIENEIFKCTGVSGAVLTVVGAQEGTSAANHPNGAAVTEVLTASALDAIRADIVQSGVTSSLPASDKAGNLYLPTDGSFISRDTGSVIERWGLIRKVGFQPLSGLTWINQGTALADDNGGMLTLHDTYVSDTGIKILKKAATGSTFTFTAWLLFTEFQLNYHRAGILLRESSSSKMHSINTSSNAGAAALVIERWTDDQNLAATMATVTPNSHIFTMGVWFRLTYDGTNILSYISGDGKVWALLNSTPKATSFTTAPNEIGIMLQSWQDGTYPIGISVISWLES